MKYQILAINPGATTTKLGLFEDEKEIVQEEILHDPALLQSFATINDQTDMRLGLILDFLSRHGYPPNQLSAVVGRGGLLPPVLPGAYLVNQCMLDDLHSDRVSPHASNLGAILADRIARPYGIPAFIYDAVSSGNLLPEAQITGLPEIIRQSFCHVLNSRACAIEYARSLGKRYEELNCIVAHLGSGISLSAHQKGKIIDSIADDDGPFAPERAGGMPVLNIIGLCYNGQHTEKEMRQKIRGQGGLRALLGTADCQEVEQRIAAGDQRAAIVYQAMALQIAKGIGLLAAALHGRVDAIILTGGVAHSTWITSRVEAAVRFIAPVAVFPGERELPALAQGALRVLCGEEQAHNYLGQQSTPVC